MNNISVFIDDERIPKDVTWLELPLAKYQIVRGLEDFYYVFEDFLRDNQLPEVISFDHDLNLFFHEEDLLELPEEISNIILSYGIKNNKTYEITGYSILKYVVYELLKRYENKTYSKEQILSMKMVFHTQNLIGKENMKAYWKNFIDFI